MRAYMQTYRLDLGDIAVLLRSERQHIAAWFIGASPPPESVHTLLFFARNAAKCAACALLAAKAGNLASAIGWLMSVAAYVKSHPTVRARSNSAVGRGRPEKHEPKPPA